MPLLQLVNHFAFMIQCDAPKERHTTRRMIDHGLRHPQRTNPGFAHAISKINVFHMQAFARFLEKLQSTPDGDGSLLDHSMIIYGAGMSNSNAHDPTNLPILVAGGGAGLVKGGRHLRLPADTPLTNLHLTLLDKIGVPVERLGDSTGQLHLLSEV